MIPLWDQDHGWRGKSQLVAPFRSASQTHLALRLFRQPKWQGPGPTDCSLCRLPLPLIPRGSDGGQVLHRLKAWASPVGVLGEGSGALQDTAPSLFSGPPDYLLAWGQVAWRSPESRPGFPYYLTVWLRTTTPWTFYWMGSLTVGCLWKGPSVALTKGWTGPLIVPW